MFLLEIDLFNDFLEFLYIVDLNYFILWDLFKREIKFYLFPNIFFNYLSYH